MKREREREKETIDMTDLRKLYKPAVHETVKMNIGKEETMMVPSAGDRENL